MFNKLLKLQELHGYESRYAARISFKYTGAPETRLAVRWKISGLLARHAAGHSRHAAGHCACVTAMFLKSYP